MIHINSFTFNPFQENTYILHSDSGESVIIDPGCFESNEKDQLTGYIEDNNLQVTKLLNTHCHIDHVLGNQFIKDKYAVDLYIHKEDEPTLRSVESYASVYGFPNYQPSEHDHFLNEGDEVQFGDEKLNVIFVPGHAPGHIAFVNDQQNICIGGDVLFQNSIGRTDLPGGDYNTLINSIHTKIFPLGDSMVVYPGHGPSTTVGSEKINNPFCRLN